MHNEFQIICENLPNCKCPRPATFETGQLVECIKAEGISWEFNLRGGQKYRVADYKKGGIALHGLSPNTFYDARRFRQVEGQKTFKGIANPNCFQSFGRVAA